MCQLITLHCSRIVIVVNAFSSVCVFLYEQTYDQFVMFSKVQRLLEIFSKVSSALLNAATTNDCIKIWRSFFLIISSKRLLFLQNSSQNIMTCTREGKNGRIVLFEVHFSHFYNFKLIQISSFTVLVLVLLQF